MKKGVIYTRVSSDEQVQGTSLAYQEEICRKYCAERDIEVLVVFREEGVSAKTAERAQLLRALEYCRKHREQVEAFVVAKVDRFARNTEDHFYVRKLLLDYGITLHSVTEPIGNSPTEKFVETVLAASSEFDNAVRRQRCTDGMVARVKQGIWPWKPPIGYRCQHTKKRGEKKRQPDPPDPECFPLIQRGLKGYAAGVIPSQRELARRLDRWGLEKLRGRKTSGQLVDRLLGNYLKFYAGILVNPWTGEEHEGLHEPMITENELHRIVLIRSGKGRTEKRDHANPLFPLRRTALCSACGRSLTGSVSRGSGGRYPYYHCHNSKCRVFGKSIRKADLEEAFVRRLERIAPDPNSLRVFEATVLDAWKSRHERLTTETRAVEGRLQKLAARRRRIFEMREEGTYSKEMFRERLSDVELRIAETKTALPEAEPEPSDISEVLPVALRVIRSPAKTWEALDASGRRQFQKLVFPDGIPYTRRRGFGTARLGLLFELSRWSNDQKSRGVDLAGFNWNRLCEELSIYATCSLS